jgi:hypothetical protein
MTGYRAPTGNTSFGNVTPKGYDQGRMQQFTPEQMQLFQSMFSQVSPGSNLAKLAGGDQSFFEQMEAPAFRQFNQLQGNLASRFSGQGLGGRKSSGFQNTMSAAGSNFAQDLQSRRQELMRQAQQDLFGMSQNLLGQRPYENFLQPQEKRKSFLEQLLGGALPIAGAGIGAYFGGPQGAQIGGSIGSAAGNAFFS